MGGADDEKVAAWNAQLYSALANGGNHQQLQQMQAQRALFTPPASAHGLSTAPSSASGNAPSNAFNDSQAFFANFQRQQQMVAMGHMYGSPEGDDSSSVGSLSAGRRRERSGSIGSGSGSGYGSPQHVSPLGSYEMNADQSEYGMPKRFSAGLQINTSVGNQQWGGRSDSAVDGMNGMMKQALTPPISVGGGGNGHGFAMMMM